MVKEVVCTECPMGCEIQVEIENNQIISILGNTCARGKMYAQNEIVCPKRVLTSTVKSVDGRLVPVKTDAPVKKAELLTLMKKLNGIICKTPIKIGDVICENFSNDVNLIATGNID